MKKIALIGIGALLTATPAMATPSHTSSTFPNDEFMLEDYTYTGQANYTNMGVYSGSVTANASYNDCPANSWCDNSGQHACSSLTGGFNTSAAGATANTDCYRACNISNMGSGGSIASIAHATALSGNDYYGAGTDTCEPSACENGYHVKAGTPDLDPDIEPTDYTYSAENMTWSVTGASYGDLSGIAVCNTTSPSSWAMVTSTDFPTGTEGLYCWCKMTAPARSAWVFSLANSSAADCAADCAGSCGSYVWSDATYRGSMFGSLGTPGPASCEANTINITWNDASAADIEANDAGTATFGGDIRTPRAATIKPGKVFVGWKFSKPSGN